MIKIDFFKKMLGFQANESSTSSINPKNEEKMNEQENKSKKARIYNLIIVDESGSMHGLEHATLTGVNEIINSLRGV